jgi:hypothetical protein
MFMFVYIPTTNVYILTYKNQQLQHFDLSKEVMTNKAQLLVVVNRQDYVEKKADDDDEEIKNDKEAAAAAASRASNL